MQPLTLDVLTSLEDKFVIIQFNETGPDVAAVLIKAPCSILCWNFSIIASPKITKPISGTIYLWSPRYKDCKIRMATIQEVELILQRIKRREYYSHYPELLQLPA